MSDSDQRQRDSFGFCASVVPVGQAAERPSAGAATSAAHAPAEDGGTVQVRGSTERICCRCSKRLSRLVGAFESSCYTRRATSQTTRRPDGGVGQMRGFVCDLDCTPVGILHSSGKCCHQTWPSCRFYWPSNRYVKT